MNKKLSIKTDDRYLRLMEWYPKEDQERCSRCCLKKGDKDCEALCNICKPMIGEDTLTGLETGGFFVDSKPLARPFQKREFRPHHNNFDHNGGPRPDKSGRGFRHHGKWPDRDRQERPTKW